MINIIKYNSLGQTRTEWLNAKHHFSFAEYYDPLKLNFGVLRVINDDVINPHSGFDTHPHKNMEIITYVRSGAITHEDNQGNKGVTKAGDVQVMSAGSGIYHSEHNLEDEDTNLYQIWIETAKKDVPPRWEQKNFPKERVTDKLNLLVSGDKHDDALFIYQNVKIYGGRLKQGSAINHKIDNQLYVLASDGGFSINDRIMNKGDGAEVKNLENIVIKAIEDCEVIIIDVPEI